METLFFGKNIIRLKEVDSTNNYAARLLRQSGSNDENAREAKGVRGPGNNADDQAIKIFEGTVVVADFQKEGKGQRGNKWESEKGKNLTFSLILTPNFLTADKQFLLNEVISLGLKDFLESLGIGAVSIKWPNDIYVGEKKIAGMLFENSIRSNEMIYSVIGIGININQQNFLSSPRATSLKIVSGKKFSRDECLKDLCSFLESRYIKFRADTSSADSDYRSSLYQLNELKNYLVRGENVMAKITGVTGGGLLILQKENGEEINCDLKEVVF